MKVNAKIWLKVVELGYPEIIAEVQGITMPLNDTAEEIEEWLRLEKDLICRVHPNKKRSFSPEVRRVGEFSNYIIKTNRTTSKSYDIARMSAIRIALRQL